MARITTPLTNTEITKSKPKEKDYTLSDGLGLYLLVKSSGAKLWRFNYYRPNSKERVLISLGRFPDVSLSQARERVNEYRALIAKGIDPQSHVKQQAQSEAVQRENTFFKICSKWYEDIYPLKANEETRRNNWGRLEKHIFPIIGDLPLSDITPKLLVELYTKIGASNTLDKLHRIIKATLDHGIKLGIIEGHNCNIAKDDFIAPLAVKHPAITIDKLPELIQTMNNAYKSERIELNTLLAFNLTLLTGLRQKELTGLEWRFIDEKDNLLIVPSKLLKQNRKLKEQPEDHIIPISSQMDRLFKTIRQFNGTEGYLFPSSLSKSGAVGKDTVANALRENGYRKAQDAHGIRSIFRTFLASKGFSSTVAELTIAHTGKARGKVEERYERYNYLEERRQAVQSVSDYCEECGMLFEIDL